MPECRQNAGSEIGMLLLHSWRRPCENRERVLHTACPFFVWVVCKVLLNTCPDRSLYNGEKNFWGCPKKTRFVRLLSGRLFGCMDPRVCTPTRVHCPLQQPTPKHPVHVGVHSGRIHVYGPENQHQLERQADARAFSEAIRQWGEFKLWVMCPPTCQKTSVSKRGRAFLKPNGTTAQRR